MGTLYKKKKKKPRIDYKIEVGIYRYQNTNTYYKRF